MAYLPDPPPIQANMNSYEFKEWLGSVQRWIDSDTGVWTDDGFPTSGRYSLDVRYSLFLFGTDGLDRSSVRLVFPHYYNIPGKIWWLVGYPGSDYTKYPQFIFLPTDSGNTSELTFTPFSATSSNVFYYTTFNGHFGIDTESAN